MMMPHRMTKRLAISVGLLMALFLLISSSYGKHKKTEEEPPFLYVAGTENIAKGCGGKLEVLKEGLTFKCPGSTLNLPFSTITLMQYRPDVSAEVMAMKIPWKVAPEFHRVERKQVLYYRVQGTGKIARGGPARKRK